MFTNRIEKFLVEATVLDKTNSTSFDISKYIHSISIKKDYFVDSFPLFVVNFMTTSELRDLMRDNEIMLDLKVSRYLDIDAEVTEDSTEQPIIDDVIIDTVIRVYEKPYTTTDIKEDEDDENSENIATTLQTIPFQIVGIPDELLLKNSTVINEVYENAKMEDIIINILSSIEKNNIFMDKTDNQTRELSLLIPPLNVIPAIKYLQDIYGIYNSQLGIFFDLDKTYLFKFFNKDRNYKNNFEIMIPNSNDIGGDLKFTTPLLDENDNIRIYLKTVPNFSSDLSVNMDTLGETTIFNSYDFDFNVVQRTFSSAELSSSKVRYYWNTYQNEIFEESFRNVSLNSAEGIGITIPNISPNYFSLDTLTTLTSNNSYANGVYGLVGSSFMLSTSDYEHYTSLLHLRFTKLK